MPLTPQDVASRTFTTKRLGREGYDEKEVDDFLDEVEAELTRLLAENADLQRRLTAAESRRPEAAAAPDGTSAKGDPASASTASPAAAQPPTEAAAGILALAQRTADEHVADATAQAERLVAEARAAAEASTRQAEERRREVLAALERDRATLERAIEELRAFEREYRSRLTAYLESQLRDLAGRGDIATEGAAAADARPA